ncbi:MAG: rod shape-determining protein MreD [Flavobacteriaceae bacterium]|nr:rod shape-determining protein MreD [Flavobacteriaceae bacterium]
MLHENIRLTKFFILGVSLQVLVFESWNFLGYVDPLFYIIFLLIYKFDGSHIPFILLSFSLGLVLDLLTQNPGSNTISCLTIGYIRPFLINLSFGVNANVPNGMISGTKIEQRILFVGLIILIHHLIYFSISYFSFLAYLNIIKNTILTGILTSIVVALTFGFMSKK